MNICICPIVAEPYLKAAQWTVAQEAKVSLQIISPLLPGADIGDHVKVADGQLLPRLHLPGCEQLLLVGDRVPLDRAVWETRVVDAIDNREHSHQTVVTVKYLLYYKWSKK